MRWVQSENLHVTLRFLGNNDPHVVPALARYVQEQTAEHSAFELSLARVDLFPSRRRPRARI